jgi:hypothetical protein
MVRIETARDPHQADLFSGSCGHFIVSVPHLDDKRGKRG